MSLSSKFQQSTVNKPKFQDSEMKVERVVISFSILQWTSLISKFQHSTNLSSKIQHPTVNKPKFQDLALYSERA